jgi:hypothetical protein
MPVQETGHTAHYQSLILVRGETMLRRVFVTDGARSKIFLSAVNTSNPFVSFSVLKTMQEGVSLSAIGNLIVIFGLVIYGVRLFLDYFRERRWARNMAALLGGMGLLFLAFALVFTPTNAAAIFYVAQAAVWRILLAVSTVFLLAAIIAFGLITYVKPLRLLHDRRAGRQLNREIGKIP